MFKKISNIFNNKKEYEIILDFDEPIPSCRIDSLKYIDGKWIFCYKVYSPVDFLNGDTSKLELSIYGHISDLQLVKNDSLNSLSANIKIDSLDEYLNYLKLQVEADKNYRKEFMQKIEYNNELKNNLQLNVVELLNKDYSNKELKKLDVNYIADIYELKNNSTIFSAV